MALNCVEIDESLKQIWHTHTHSCRRKEGREGVKKHLIFSNKRIRLRRWMLEIIGSKCRANLWKREILARRVYIEYWWLWTNNGHFRWDLCVCVCVGLFVVLFCKHCAWFNRQTELILEGVSGGCTKQTCLFVALTGFPTIYWTIPMIFWCVPMIFWSYLIEFWLVPIIYWYFSIGYQYNWSKKCWETAKNSWERTKKRWKTPPTIDGNQPINRRKPCKVHCYGLTVLYADSVG